MRKFSLLIIILLAFSFFGCKKTEKSSPDNNAESQINEAEELAAEGQSRYILIAGDNFIKDWFTSWGWKDDDVMTMERFSMQYVKAGSRETFVSDISKTLDQATPEEKDLAYVQIPAEFFAGEEVAEEFLEKNKVLVQDIYDLVVNDNGMELILGNTLPGSIDDSDIYLIWSHQQFNDWLNDFWREHSDNVSIFNVYDLTSNDLGRIPDGMKGTNGEYLTDNAYKFLDEKFFSMLESVY